MENPVKRDQKKIVWWGLICVLVFAAAQKNIPALWILHRRGLAAQGTVTDKEPYHNQRIHYTYSVDDRIYSGAGHGGCGNPLFKDISYGDTVSVIYDSSYPQRSAMGKPYAHLMQRVMTVGLMGFVLFCLISYIFYIISNFNTSQNKNSTLPSGKQ